VNSEAGSTGRSAQDDGYGTESGSNQKVNTVSTLSLDCGFRIYTSFSSTKNFCLNSMTIFYFF
jgi:hypothetical protein